MMVDCGTTEIKPAVLDICEKMKHERGMNKKLGIEIDCENKDLGKHV